jgi:hypothetical protein
MQQQKTFLAKSLVIGVLFYSPCALAQISGSPGGGAASSGARTTTGIASDQAHIPSPGTNSLGTANSSGRSVGGTVGANREPKDSRAVDAEIQNENAAVDSKISGICRGC